ANSHTVRARSGAPALQRRSAARSGTGPEAPRPNRASVRRWAPRFPWRLLRCRAANGSMVQRAAIFLNPFMSPHAAGLVKRPGRETARPARRQWRPAGRQQPARPVGAHFFLVAAFLVAVFVAVLVVVAFFVAVFLAAPGLAPAALVVLAGFAALV